MFSDYSRDFLGIANTEVLLIGLALLTGAVLVSVFFRKTAWVEITGPSEHMYNLLMSCFVSK
jgi:hypothetical protein